MRSAVKGILFLVFLLFSLILNSQYGYALDQSAYQLILEQHVHDDGSVDLEGIKKEQTLLNRYLDLYQSVSWNEVISMPREDQIAFWINAYNASLLKYFSEHGTAESAKIEDLMLRLKDTDFSLKDIKDDMLRRRYRDERIHFVLWEGIQNGPQLRNEPYNGKNLDVQMDQQIRLFLQDDSRNRIKPGDKYVILSYIFKENADDFLLNYGAYNGKSNKKFSLSQMAVLSFIAQHSSEEAVHYLTAAKYKIKYFPKEKGSGHLN